MTEFDEKIKDLYCNKKIPAKAIGQMMGCSIGTVIRRLTQMGITMRPRGGPNHVRTYPEKMAIEEPERLKAVLDDEEATLKAKAARLNCTPSTLRRYLKSLEGRDASKRNRRTSVR